jgi:hypothetical protein
MKAQRVVLVLTVVNLGLLAFLLPQLLSAKSSASLPVLRGRALEIVDLEGRVRASIMVQPADRSAVMPDGKPYPETVILRLIDPNGRPSVKLGTSVLGSGLVLGGSSDPTYVVLKAEDATAFVKLTNKDGRQQVIKP